MKKGGTVLPPVVDLKSRKEDGEDVQAPILGLGAKVNFDSFCFNYFHLEVLYK